MPRQNVWIALLLFIALVVAAGAFVAAGYAQPPSRWIALLHLNDCAMPCWIGIKPGVSTVGEALQRLNGTYGGSDFDLVSQPDSLAFIIADRASGYRFTVALNADFRAQTAPIIRDIVLYPYAQSGSARPLMGDLYAASGTPAELRLTRRIVTHTIAVLYEQRRVIVFANSDDCNRIYPHMEITSIRLSSASQIADESQSSQVQPWNGFGECHFLS
jgi:hypothetical protein